MIARARAALKRAVKDFAYLLIGGLTASIALCVWTVGLSLSIGLAILIIGVPVVLLTAKLFRVTSELDRQNARLIFGVPVVGRYRVAAQPGLWARSKATLTDPQTLRDTAWLILHSILGLTFAIVAISMLAVTLGAATAPLWNHTIPDDAAQWGPWPLGDDSGAWMFIVASVPLAALTIMLNRGMALAEAHLAAALLGTPATRNEVVAEEPAHMAPAVTYRAEVALPAHVAGSVFIAALCALVWLLSGLGTFWPVWVWLPLALSVALHLAAVRFVNADDRPQRLRAAAEAEMATVLFLVGLWAAAGGGAFWPLWPAVTIAVIHGGVVLALAAPWRERGELTERVAVLTRTRRDAVDAQAEQLRQIERDLHDGAQARLVALSMQLGRAESRLADRPEEAELLRLAREEAGAAIAELRDLARGIAPPILVDRGLAAAVDALGRRASLKVTLVSDLTARQSPAVEGCAYFVCAEALTNAAKHAPQAEVEIQLTKQEGKLLVIVKDDGPGGADSGGSGLTGLRQRVAALDGTLTVGTVSGEGTTIRAELPCES